MQTCHAVFFLFFFGACNNHTTYTRTYARAHKCLFFVAVLKLIAIRVNAYFVALSLLLLPQHCHIHV